MKHSKMSLPDQALQKLVQEIETQAIQSQRDIGMVKATIGAKQRDIRLLELTVNEVKSLPGSTNIYEGLGKAFVMKPRQEVERRLSSDASELKSEIGNLHKKLHYLETTNRNSKEHIAQILGSSR